MRHTVFALLLALPLGCLAQSGTLISRTSGADIGQSIEGLLVDYSAASVSAAELAKLGTTPVTVVENVRDFSVALQGDTPLSKKVFGVAITPARTSFAFPRIALADYAGGQPGDPKRDLRSLPDRLLGSLSFGYAQGKSEHGGQEFNRRAISMETSAFFRVADDPVVAVADRGCASKALDAVGIGTDGEPVPKPTPPGRPVLKPVKPAEAKKGVDAYNECAGEVLAELDQRWNRSRFSLSYATGWIKRSDGSGEQLRLGHTLGFGVVYGFDHFAEDGMLRNRAAATLVLRRASNEPVLDTLVNGPLARENSTLAAMRLAGGSSSMRGLVEFSNAKSTSITTTQSRMRRALGLDYRVMDGLWLGLRAGKQRKVDGSGEEVGTFMTLGYSPSATLGH